MQHHSFGCNGDGSGDITSSVNQMRICPPFSDDCEVPSNTAHPVHSIYIFGSYPAIANSRKLNGIDNWRPRVFKLSFWIYFAPSAPNQRHK